MRRSAILLMCVAAIALVAAKAFAVDRNFAGSIQLDYLFVPTEHGNLNAGEDVGTYGFDGFTIEAAEKLSVDVSNHLSANVKVCFGCHGFELDMAYVDYRVADEFNLRAGRFSPSFGSFNLRHDVGNYKFSDKPLPYDMGRMLRMRTWNMGVIPSPFPDNGVEVNGSHWFGDSTEIDYAVYAVMGFKSTDTHPHDLRFDESRMPYYVDDNARPTVGARVALTQKLGGLSDVTIGASGMYGTYDRNNQLTYAILGGDVSFRIRRTSIRMEYLVRRTEMDTTDATDFALPVASPGKDAFTKQGAYIEIEQPLSASVDLLGRVDGLYRIGNYLKPEDEDDVVPLARRSSILRYSLGGSYAFERGFRMKLSTELWQFSDRDEDGHRIDVGVHAAFVGTY